MCCLPLDHALPVIRGTVSVYRSTPCTATLASRLRRIGDQFDKKRMTREKGSMGNDRGRERAFNHFHLMCTAIQVALVIMYVRKRL